MLCMKATHEKEKPVLNKCEAHVFFCACRGLGVGRILRDLIRMENGN